MATEETLKSIAFTLSHIWLQDHRTKIVSYPKMDEEEVRMPMVVEEVTRDFSDKGLVLYPRLRRKCARENFFCVISAILPLVSQNTFK